MNAIYFKDLTFIIIRVRVINQIVILQQLTAIWKSLRLIIIIELL